MNSFANYRATNCEAARGEDPESLLDLSACDAQADDPVESYVDEVLKPLYDKITELTQENAKLREALRKLREPARRRVVREATDGSDNTLSVQLHDAGFGSQGIL